MKHNKCKIRFGIALIAGMMCGCDGITEIESGFNKDSATVGFTKMKNDDTSNETAYIDDDLLILVNENHHVPDDWNCELVDLRYEQKIDARAYPDLQQMMDDARTEGLEPLICSSYRSYEKQMELFEAETAEYLSQGCSVEEAKELAAEWVAMPGTSEHELGLAVDIVAMDNQRLDETQETTPEQQWLMEHCHEYGFILRYPEDKQEITNIGYEPWHYRYVGKEAAKEIMEQGLCLEEYLKSSVSK